ncbi:MAG: EFR1 family ferrodoxin [Treponema sp.]|jgi:NAD-dependent dihydropyrimidine dehydrogenase PreA subunit|nr:EFR1 family ferrodoxin [Treponema sp.]
MKKLLLILWSGTGNTLRVAELLRESFARRGISGDILDIAKEPHVTMDDYDIIGLGYPVYAYNAPAIFVRYVKNLRLADRDVFIFKSSGEPLRFNNASSRRLIRLLSKCRVLGEYHFLMPYNIMFRFPDNLVKQMYQHAEGLSETAAEEIATRGGRPLRGYKLPELLVSVLLGIQCFGALVNGPLFWINRKCCTRCMKCLNECPAKNITFKEGSFRFGFKCQMCMRCTLYCPADAVRPGLLNLWRVNGPYPFDALMADEGLDGKFITPQTRGIYRIFRPYFEGKADGSGDNAP